MEVKQRIRVELKALGDTGSFEATFATLGVIDRDGDVTVSGAFQDGQEVRISAWGHNWGALPVGKGVIHADDQRAWVDGQFFLETPAGQDTYQTVKLLGGLQEWSYGFDVKDWSVGEFEGRQVRFLRGLDVFEVSPVMIGAGIDTQTDVIKAGKTGARNAAADMKRLQAIHESLVELGVKCSPDEPKATGQEPSEATPQELKAGEAAARAAREMLQESTTDPSVTLAQHELDIMELSGP